ncbi:unnamed protein product [Mycena citricolor]|uniref:Uncharacterized protein n=1 Tax=Mycena citricolor TaxID=2018698 RepID=A0AAD2HNU1_9AGAR|nr:unnamed protein product [Mycena citricolor]
MRVLAELTVEEQYYRELEKQLAEWFFTLSIHDQWSKCRLYNSRAHENKHSLRPLLTALNRVPISFPETLLELRRLDRWSVITLLQAYAQPVTPPMEHDVDLARRALARFIGAPPY